ncbi:MAG: DKNYY domain-containing protein [Actinomycetota bacterium]
MIWNGRPIAGADAKSFRVLGGAWARDDARIYTQGAVRRGIDVGTFQFLNPVYAKDAAGVYDWEGTIKGADPETFAALDSGIFVEEAITLTTWARGYARDAAAVYYHDQMVGRASMVRGADPATFVSLRNDYGFDAKSVWLQKSRLPKADPRTWTYLGRLWSADQDRMYYAEREVSGINRSRFTLVGAPTIGNFASDGERFFSADRPIPAEEFWADVNENFGAFEQRFRVAWKRLHG